MNSSLFSLDGKIAVVVGGTSGIGRALALGLAEAGANVVASSRSEKPVHATAAEIEKLGRKTLRIASDVASALRWNNFVTQPWPLLEK
jgi:NAD(P)-dependent dehydrogenase (short-subunit alcohol dehydrogenase family)